MSRVVGGDPPFLSAARYVCLSFYICLLYYIFNRATHQVILFLIWYVGLLRFYHMLWNVLVSLLLFNDGFVCCCLLSFIASLSVELVFCRFLLFGCCVLFYVVLHVVDVFLYVFDGIGFDSCC